MMSRLSFLGFLALLSFQGISAEDVTEDEIADETTSLMKQLTIANSADVIDERTFSVRNPKTKQRDIVRLGNVAPLERGSLSEDQHQERVDAGMAALAKLVGQSMFLWKAAAEEHQPTGDDADFVLGDAWTVDGRHVPNLLITQGHLVASPAYESELAKDILSAASGKEKQEAYAKLGEATRTLQASAAAEAATAAASQAKKEAEESPAEPIGFGGWVGLLAIVALVVGALAIGKKEKKENKNRKKSSFEKVWNKMKGQ